MSADSPRRSSGSSSRGVMAVPAIVPPQVVSDRSILDSAIGFINEVTLAHQPPIDPKDTITWARFETTADISDSRYGEDWELDGNIAPPLLLILGYGLGVQVWAIPANGEAVEVLSWRHGIVSSLRVLPSPLSTLDDEGNGRADEPIDAFGDKRPLIALVDGTSTSGSQPQFCAVNFISLKTGAQVKTIKFKNPVIDILANRSSIVITFHERIAVFDARTLEDRLSITTCYPSPGINPNPAALGPRWLAYAENKLLHTKRSGGGCDGDGVASYTATVLNASKSLVKGLRELGEQVAAGLTGTSGSAGNSKNPSFDSVSGLDTKQAGIVTIIDIKCPPRDYSPTSSVPTSSNQIAGNDSTIAHFIAHSEALVAMEFDNSGMLLVTADRRGHDFHVFRIQPNTVGSSLAAVHHLYILHRGDTSAKVQNITLTLDSRWVAVSTLRGTTHVFPITPYGGTMGVRTHTSLHVVNKLSRFHRSAGLSGEGRSNSPISHSESTTFSQSLQPYNNSTLPPFPRPTVVMPLAQLRQPFALGSPPGSTTLTGVKSVGSVTGSGSQRQRLSSLSDDSGKPLSVCAVFAKSRSWLLDPPNVTREAPHRIQRKSVDSLFIMAGHGALIQYDLGTKLASNVAKERICDDTPIELEVEAKAQWNLGRRKEGAQEITPPLSSDNWLIKNRNSCMLTDSTRQYDDSDERSESWLAQVEIITHAGPHRRLWMGPQFVFKTYNTPSGSNLHHVDIEAVEIGTTKPSSTVSSEKLDHSNPLNMPLTAAGRSSAVPVLIESGSYSSIEQSPKLMDRFRHDHLDSDYSVAHGDSRLKEDLADAMRESPSAAVSSKDAGGHICEIGDSSDNVAFYDALTAEDDQIYVHAHLASAAALASVLPNIHSYDNSSSYESQDLAKKPNNSIEKIVNPLGTVTTVTSCITADIKKDILDEVVSQLAAEDAIIHENCDESLFRPVVAIFCDEKTLLQNEEEARKNSEKYQPPENITNKLIVPVIAKDLNDELSKREKEKNSAIKCKPAVPKAKSKELQNFEELSLLNRKPKECKRTNVHEAEAILKRKMKVSPLIENICKNKETGCSKAIDSFIETTATIKITPNKRIRNTLHVQDKRTEVETIVSTLQKVEKESKCSDISNKNYVKQVENTETKCKTELLSSNEQNDGKEMRNAVRICEKYENFETVNKLSEGFKTTDSVLEQKEPIEAKTVNDNPGSKSDESFFPAPHNSIKVTTAMKEKVKNIEESIKSNELNTIDNKITKQFQQLPGNFLGEMEQTEGGEEIEVHEIRETKITEGKTGSEKIILTTNPFVNEKRNKLNIIDISPLMEGELGRSKVVNEKERTMHKKDSFQERDNQASNVSDWLQPKKTVKTKGKDSVNKEQQMAVKNMAANLELDKMNMPEEDTRKDDVTDYVSLNAKNDFKDRPRKTKADNKVIKKAISNEEQILDSVKDNHGTCETNKQVNNCGQLDRKRKVHSLEIEIKPEKLPTDCTNDDVEKNAAEQKLRVETMLKSGIIKEERNNENKTKSCHELPDLIQNTASEIKKSTMTLSTASPKKRGKETPKIETKKDTVSKYEEKRECQSKNENIKENKTKSKSGASNEKGSSDVTFDACGKADKIKKKLSSPIIPPVSVWRTLSGADMINTKLNKSDSEFNKFPSLVSTGKINNSGKLLPEIPTPAEMEKQTNLDEFSMLRTLDPLPPLPALEPLQLMGENNSMSPRDISLITFESPLFENPSLERKITPTPRGFTEQNLILALCGSLYYENEHTEIPEISPTFSSNHSSTAFEDNSLADYKSLTENDDPYISLEQSSQDTNTTNTNTTNEKCNSSTNSSGSEEIVIMEEKKMTKKQKRKKQQQLKELQVRKQQNDQQEIDDEELRPLLVMTDSQLDQTINDSHEILPASTANFDNNPSMAIQPIIYSTTTDSEGPLPATTSDDNVFSIPVPVLHTPHKIKTKKLEHKINLIAAIEAATSSSTSSAEESGVELAAGPSSLENADSLLSESNNISTSTVQLPMIASCQTTVGALKKKTKRRKR